MARELALFAGAGGGILGGLLLGWRTVCAVELDAYCRSVLLARQRDGVLAPFPIWDDVRTFDGEPWRGHVDVISGGFPCQDISAAGAGAGIDGAKSGLWVEMARIIREVRPRYALVENSPMLASRGLGRVLGDLAEMGFDARWGVFSAAEVGAPHLRERIFILASDSHRVGRDGGGLQPERQPRGSNTAVAGDDGPRGDASNAHGPRQLQPEGREPEGRRRAGNGAEPDADPARDGRRKRRTRGPVASGAGEGEQPLSPLPDAHGQGLERPTGGGNAGAREPSGGPAEYGSAEDANAGSERRRERSAGGWWSAEPDVVRMVHGVPSRVDRIRGLGNAQVPAVVRLAWRTLTEEMTQ